MAPRRRPKKVGLKREDAAIDHVADLGFSRSAIRKTLKELLKEYGGEQGWFFIEEGSYKLLIEKILDEEEKRGKEVVAEEKPEEVVVVPDSGSRTLEDRDEENFGTAPELQTPQAAEHAGSGRSCGSEESKLNESTAPLRCRTPIYGWLSEDEDEFEKEHSGSAIVEQRDPNVAPRRVRTRPRGWDVIYQA